MNIYLAFQQSVTNHPIPAYSFWQYYIKNGIEEAGNSWLEQADIDWALGLVPKKADEQRKWRDQAWEKTIDYLKGKPVDLFLSYLYPSQVDPSAISEIQRMGIPCVNFFCDHVREFHSVPAEFSIFDLNWVPEMRATTWYKKNNLPFIHLPMPMWIEPKLRVPKAETNSAVTFIGSKDLQRCIFFNQLFDAAPDLPLEIYGSGWDDTAEFINCQRPDYRFGAKIKFNLNVLHTQGLTAWLRKLRQRDNRAYQSIKFEKSRCHGTIPFDSYNDLLTASMITLGINRYPSYRYPLNKPDTYSRLRDIEAPMLGACYVTEWTDGVEELYDIENEVLVYKDAGGLIDIVNRLAKDSMRRQTLRNNAQKRALSDHNIPRSLRRLSSVLFGARHK